MTASGLAAPSPVQPQSQPRLQPSPPPSILPPNKRDNTTPSCAVCQRRKVKCDRRFPCAPCLKTGLECSFRTASHHRAKRRKTSRVKSSDETMQTSSPTSPMKSTAVERLEAVSPILESTTARLVPCSGGYRYVNNHLWHTLPAHENLHPSPEAASTMVTSISSAQHTPIDGTQSHRSAESGHGSITRHSSDTPSVHFIFHQRQPMHDIVQLPPGHIVQLWHIYLERVDPMMKAFHSPSVQQLVLGQIGKAEVLPHEHALVSAVYLISVVSLTDSECQSILHTTRHDALEIFRKATETALSAAGFVTTTDFTVLQALVLYLAALRSLGDAATVWSLLGVTIRIAGTQGLARDGSFLSLPPFEAELRRRLWWAIVYMDARTAELVGQDGDLLVQKHDVKPPSNLNDNDLFPSMKRIPESKSTSTEMLYVQFRATLASIMRTLPSGFGAGGTFKRLENPNIPLAEKLEMIKMLEQRLDEEILRGCDPGIPLQLFTMNAVQTLLNKMRLIAHISLTYVDSTWSANGKYSEEVFCLSASLVHLQLDLWNEPCLRRWQWHWRGQFQWFALACLIRQSRFRAPGERTTEAWTIIRKVFDMILPSLDVGARKGPLIVGIQSLLNAGTTTHSIPSKRQIQNNDAVSATTSRDSVRQSTENTVSTSPCSVAESTALQGDKMKIASQPELATRPLTTNDTSVGVDFEFDFDAIDWAEFDRLTAELCQQGG